MGIAGGLNGYLYAAGNPLRYSDPHGLNPILASVIYGAVSGGISAYISSGGDLRSTAVGAGFGAITGLAKLPPVAGAMAASLAGQAAANKRRGKELLNPCNYDPLGILWAGVGGVAIRAVKPAIGRYAPVFRHQIIGRPLNKPGINRTVGDSTVALTEGGVVGLGEYFGSQSKETKKWLKQ